MNLLTTNQVKMLKSSKLGYLSAILNLSPAFEYKGLNTCPMAGQCKGFCLQNTGRNRFDIAQEARIRRTKQYVDDKASFYALLIADIEALVRKAKRENALPTVRLNGLSDIAFEDDILSNGKTIFDTFPDIQFIDYTKRYDRMFKQLPSNYHLTYSINENTPEGMISAVYAKTRFNCAAVFYGDMPVTYKWDAQKFAVISGDDTDLRHLDPRVEGDLPVVIGLNYKLPFSSRTGKAIRPTKSGFIILNNK